MNKEADGYFLLSAHLAQIEYLRSCGCPTAEAWERVRRRSAELSADALLYFGGHVGYVQEPLFFPSKS